MSYVYDKEKPASERVLFMSFTL